MTARVTTPEFLALLYRSDLLDQDRLQAYLRDQGADDLPEDPSDVARTLVRDGLLTPFQANQLLIGRWRGFSIGNYRVLEKIASGGMSGVYLCVHKETGQRVAIKVLPADRAQDPECLKRFRREAKACSAFDHPNLVKAHDVGQDDKLHFLVLEYVEGSSFQDIVTRGGPMDAVRAAHYIRQAAVGLQHAHEAGLVHRDIKPGNLILDRSGTVKILDMGLARFFNDDGSVLTQGMLGTADYLAPEQAMDSHTVDNRADIYSLGATFYFLVTGTPPFGEGKSLGQKLIAHQLHQPKPACAVRPAVPAGLSAIIERMMAKDLTQRYQTPAEIVQAVQPWTRTPIAPPPEEEMPRLSPAARGDPARPTQTAIPLRALRDKLTQQAIPLAAIREELTASDTPLPGRPAPSTPPARQIAPLVRGNLPSRATTGTPAPAPSPPHCVSLTDLGLHEPVRERLQGRPSAWLWLALLFAAGILAGAVAVLGPRLLGQ
jgi:serine/threonine protein kinase